MTNLELMKLRLEHQGGVNQEDRMIQDKYRTFLKTLKYSYQGCNVMLDQKYNETYVKDKYTEQYRALINPDKTKQDYDDKILSIDYKSGFELGDVFRWVFPHFGAYQNQDKDPDKDPRWLIYLPASTEDAYFRGEIRLCDYKIKFKDKDGNTHITWAAIRGPLETQIESIQKNQIRVNTPNLGLNILLPKNEYTISAFDRYSEFLLNGKCWRVQAPDSISMTNVLEVNAEEYYIDRDTDDVQEELKNGLVIEPVDPMPQSQIIGSAFIRPRITEIYSCEQEGNWFACNEEGSQVPVCIIPHNDFTAEVTWQKTTSGKFFLKKGSAIKEITVESLF